MNIFRTEEEITKHWQGDIYQPLLSIGCVTYNHEMYIRDALEGFLIQETNFPFQICILDDASTDNNVEIIKEYAELYPSIFKCFFLEENTWGKPYRLEKAKPFLDARDEAKYIAMCEGDDYWTDPYKLQKQVDFLEENPGFSLCFHNALILWEDKSQDPKYFCSKDQKAISTIVDVIEKWFIPTASMVFRSEYIKPLPDWFSKIYNGDYGLQLLLASKGKIGYVDEMMSVYRKAPGSLSFNPKITTEYINNQKIILFNYFNEETKFNFEKEIKQKIIILKKEIKNYKLKQKNKFLYYLLRPKKSLFNIIIMVLRKLDKRNSYKER